MIESTSSQAEVRRAGLEALARELGPVGMVRFLQQFETGSGDYSENRHALLGDSNVATLAAAIRRRRSNGADE
jgi:hypothetical protein